MEEFARADRVSPRPWSVRLLLGARGRFRYLIPGGAIVVLLAGGGFAALETDTVGSYWEGVWWALSLMTTAGFANGTPATALGKALSSVIMVLGFGPVALTTAAFASLFVREDEAPEGYWEQVFEETAIAELRQLNSCLDPIESRLPPSD